MGSKTKVKGSRVNSEWLVQAAGQVPEGGTHDSARVQASHVPPGLGQDLQAHKHHCHQSRKQ